MNIAQKQSIPDYVLQSMFLRQGGFRVFSGLLSSEWQAAMFEEASELMPYAEDNVTMGHDSEEIRGGTPPRSFLSVTAGSVLNAFYQSPEVKTFLEQVTGIPVYLSGMQGTYSFYARPGDYLGLHRDIVTCDLAVITCLHDSNPEDQGKGTLCLYPSRYSEPLSAIRSTPQHGLVPAPLGPGQTIVMYGGIVPHLVTPMSAGQIRIISVLCYRV